ncbi:MAG: alpha/beta hydrolase [Shimia sp.]|uniref:alpha/beta hydrolase n=1 Tax=Shimia sp. TaxID=1954381 RepID=UPI0040598036
MTKAAQKLQQLTTLAGLRVQVATMSRVAPTRAARLLARLFASPQRKARRASKRFVSPAFDVQWRMSAEGAAFPVYVGRANPNAPTICLVHGHSGTADQMAGFVGPLTDAGFHVLSLDMPGHGAAEDSRAAIPEFLRALQQVEAEFGPFAGTIAHSLGTVAVVAAAYRGSPLGRLALIAPPNYAGVFLTQLGRALWATDRVLGRAQAIIEARHGETFEDLHVAAIAPFMTAPALIFQDREDTRVALDSAERIAEAWPDAELCVTEGLGHVRILRDNAVISSIVGFVTDTQHPLATAAE